MTNRRFLDTTIETDFLQSFVRGNLTSQETKEDKNTKPSTIKSSRRESTKPVAKESEVPESSGILGSVEVDKNEEKTKKEVKIVESGVCSKFLAEENKSKRKEKGSNKKLKKKTIKSEELYTDKDRAAAVNLGTKDIKQSLRMKRAQDRNKSMQIPEEADPAQFLALGYYEMKKQETAIALNFINKALELNPNEKHALVARSKCYILLGQPDSGLKDAEAALRLDKKFLKAIYQKAESLYYLGDFEYSLMYFHRGLHIRPDHEDFKMGVEKAQEAIETALGVNTSFHKQNTSNKKKIKGRSKSASPSMTCLAKVNDNNNNVSFENTKEVGESVKNGKPSSNMKRISSKLTGSKVLKELAIDKEYLQSLLRNPHLQFGMSRETDKALECVQETVDYLNKRQEFWRQQIPKH